ncbi:hypothetical protein IRJ41_003972, partial [Triplophysa rosa]
NNPSSASIQALPVTTGSNISSLHSRPSSDIWLILVKNWQCAFGEQAHWPTVAWKEKVAPPQNQILGPLTPHKYRAIKGCFQKWLEGKDFEEAELKARAGKLG